MTKELIKCIIPKRLEIGNGFVITSTGKVSTQCDLIIYDKNNCPLIENENEQRFFPIECVVAIGEIKSDLTKEKMEEALVKLRNNKSLRNEIPSNNLYVYSEKESKIFNPSIYNNDQLITFLICNQFKFNYYNLVNEMDDIYGDDDSYYLRHNLILSINDGVVMYKGFPSKNKLSFYPCVKEKKLKNSLLEPCKKGLGKNNNYEHIIGFLNYLYIGTSSTSIMYPEMTNYIQNIHIGKITDEKITNDD